MGQGKPRSSDHSEMAVTCFRCWGRSARCSGG